MTISFGSRFTSLPKWSASTDAFSREQFTNAFTQIDASAAGWSESALDSTGLVSGFFHYNTATDQLKIRADSAWVLVSDGNEMRSSTIDAKGDLLVGTADNTVGRLAVGGTNSQALVADSSAGTGMAWANIVNSLTGTSNIDVSANYGAITISLPSAVTIGTLTIDSVAISTIQTESESFADNDTSLMTSAAINDRIALLDSDTTYTSSDFIHDDLTGFVANEHIDWSATNGANIHATNYTNTTYTADGTSISLTGGVFSHADTSSQANSSNSDQTFIQSITLDAYGHIQTIDVADPTNTNTTYAAETDGGLSLSGSNKFSIASGPTISGGLTVAGKLEVSNSNLEFGSSPAWITTTNGENAIKVVQDGGVTLYHNGTGTFTTTSEGATVLGNITVTGGLTVDATTLHVDIANNRVGIGTTTPGYSLDVTGTTRVTGVITASGGVAGALTGNADTATALATARTIGGVSFDGTVNINLPGVNAAGNQNTSGTAATATALATARTINGVSFDGTGNVTVTAAAGTLSGSTLASGVTASSLTSVGALTALTVTGDLKVDPDFIGTDTFFVDVSTDRVGINTSSPSYTLDVTGTARATAIRTSNGTLANPAYAFVNAVDAGMAFVDAGQFGKAVYLVQANSGGGENRITVNNATAAVGASPYSTGGLGTYSSPGGFFLYDEGGYLFKSSSMRALKDEITTLDNAAALARIQALRPVSFIMKESLIPEDKKPWNTYDVHRGFIAEEVAEVDHQYAAWWWQDPDDSVKSRPAPGNPTHDDEADPETYDMADAVPVDWGFRPMVADLVAVVQSLESRLTALEA